MEFLQRSSSVVVGVLSLGVVWLLNAVGLFGAVCGGLPWLYRVSASLLLVGGVWWMMEEWLANGEVSSRGKAVLVTGCDTGFGNLIARRLEEKGFYVFAGCLCADSKEAKSLSEFSENMFVVSMDVTSDESVNEARKVVMKKLQVVKHDLWAVIANAGIGTAFPFEDTQMEQIRNTFEVNTFGVLRTAKSFLPTLRNAKGRFIVTTSVAADMVLPGLTVYSMTKAAARALVHGLRRELHHYGVFCTSVEPYFFNTKLVMDIGNFSSHSDSTQGTLTNDDYSESLKMQSPFYELMKLCASNNLQIPIKCFEHSVCSIRPKTSYRPVAPESWLAAFLCRTLPIDVADVIVLFLLRVSKTIVNFMTKDVRK